MGLVVVIFLIAGVIYLSYKLYIKNKTKPKFILTLESINIKIEGVIKMLGLKSNQKVHFKLKPVDRHGNVATIEAGSAVITSSDEAIFTVVRDPANELEGDIFSQGIGTAQFDYKADADLGEGVVEITGFSAVEVTPEGAVGFGIEFGEPTDV